MKIFSIEKILKKFNFFKIFFIDMAIYILKGKIVFFEHMKGIFENRFDL